jgi:hypothetical protein
MKLQDAFERIFAINLPFRTDRRARLERHLEETGIASAKDITWVRAICGDWTPPPAWWGAGNGAWGCLMSHVRIAQDAVHDELASYCVLEDDVVFHRNAPGMLDLFMREIPSDWGQLYLGGQFLHREPKQVSPWVLRPSNVNRTHAFALSKSTIPRFLQHIMHAPDYFDMRTSDEGTAALNHNYFHIDHQLGRAHERGDWTTYAPMWWIAGQQAGTSNISGRVTPCLWWHWRGRGHKLPFFFLENSPSTERRNTARNFLHCGYNLLAGTLIDIGLEKDLSDSELSNWLKMIAGEAVERWMLPGFEIPSKHPDLFARVQRLWEPGICQADPIGMADAAKYPFNGLCSDAPIQTLAALTRSAISTSPP